MLIRLLALANKLDKLGLYKEAGQLDTMIKIAVSQSALIRALKSDNVVDVRKALDAFIASVPSYSTPERELGMTEAEYKDFVNSIKAGHLDTAKDLMGIGKPLPSQSQRGVPKSSLVAELKRLKAIIEPHRGPATGRYHTSYMDDRIEVDAGLAFDKDSLVKELENAGYKQYMKDGEMASRSKMIGKDRIVVDVDIAGNAVPTSISLEPVTKENYDAIANVFGGVRTYDASGVPRELAFNEAVKEFEDYMKQPGP